MISQPREAQYVSLNDGRKLCLECLGSAIMDTHECHPLHLDILEFYEGLNMKVEQQIPLLLVERQALNEAMEGEKNVKRLRDSIKFHSTMCYLLLECVWMVPIAQLEYCQQNKWLSFLFMLLGGLEIRNYEMNNITVMYLRCPADPNIQLKCEQYVLPIYVHHCALGHNAHSITLSLIGFLSLSREYIITYLRPEGSAYPRNRLSALYVC